MRSINTRGRQVIGRLAWAEDVFGSDPTDAPRVVEWLEEGEAITRELARAMHGDLNPRAIDESRIRTWLRVGRESERELQRRYGVIGRRFQAANMTEGEAVEAISRGRAMAGIEAPYVIDRAGASDYEPFMIEGTQVGEIRWLTRKGSSGNTLEAAVWRSDPATYDYLFEDDEAFVVLEGVVTITLPDTGESLELRAGDVAYFDAGTPSVWRVTEPFKRFTVVPA